MIHYLHQKGYKDIYLYSGMSPSGMHWRYSIGKIKNGYWSPADSIVAGSTGVSGSVEWSEDHSSVEVLSENFISHYKLGTEDQREDETPYSIWYSQLLKMLDKDEMLIFYADYSAHINIY
ncbi:hypothetical protein [Marinibactrum halimedae]|uniref:Uncharacterized protein n=1 Tax=Marinibactrum halimedae TaxID=1444977 RepID=A0AA37T9A0_9GAMM|nr:hypothetical protein [Marinibactrum halimedae]MCD9458113.1 hypothetical protein [Marinibactrum halimedae]GLS25047.1 hypothetical protein GCM10007877_07610 [Marinibactrum halimedae]